MEEDLRDRFYALPQEDQKALIINNGEHCFPEVFASLPIGTLMFIVDSHEMMTSVREVGSKKAAVAVNKSAFFIWPDCYVISSEKLSAAITTLAQEQVGSLHSRL